MADQSKLLPFLRWWPLVNKQTLQADLLAGLTGAILVLPQGIAFSMIAGLPPIYGLYTAIVTPIVAALFGSSLHLVSGPTTTSSIAVFATVSVLAVPQSDHYILLALGLTIMVGIIQFSLGLARLGALVNFISYAVITGYTAGAAVLIATNQVRHVIGLSIPGNGSFFDTWAYIIGHATEFNPATLLLGMGTLVISFLIKRLLRGWPYLLIAMLLGAVIAYFLRGYNIPVVSEMPQGLPAFRWPNLDMAVLKELMPGAFAVAMLGVVEVTSISRSIAAQSRQRLDANQEFIGLGLSNIVGGLFSSYAGSGSFTRSGVNYASGAKTPIAAISAAVFLMLIVLLMAPLASYLPIPTMGGIILFVAYSLIDFKSIRQIARTSKSEMAVLALTFFSTVVINLQFAILAGVFFSLIFYLMRTSNPKIVTLSANTHSGKRKFVSTDMDHPAQCPQLHIIRIDGSLFFGAVESIKTTLHELSDHKRHILIVGSGINFIDVSGADLLVRESGRLRGLGGGLYFCQMKPVVRDFLDRGYVTGIGRDHFFERKEDAIAAIYGKLDRSVCQSCTARIFMECVA